MAGNRSGSEQRVIAGASRDGVFKALAVEADRHGGVGRGALPTPPIHLFGGKYLLGNSFRTYCDRQQPGHAGSRTSTG